MGISFFEESPGEGGEQRKDTAASTGQKENAGNYPTPTGEKLYQLALLNRGSASPNRTYELAAHVPG